MGGIWSKNEPKDDFADDIAEKKEETLIKERVDQIKPGSKEPASYFIQSTEEFQTSEGILRSATGVREFATIDRPELQTASGAADIVSADKPELSPQRVIQTASGGLALKGILVTRNGDHCVQERDVLEVPEGVVLRKPRASQKDDAIEFSSKSEADHFLRSLNTFGNKLTSKEGSGSCGIQTGESFTEHHQEEEEKKCESHGAEKYHCRVEYSYFPASVCELDQSKLKLSENVVAELKKLDKLVHSGSDETAMLACEEFLNRYGSHINIGPIELGGIYEWVAMYSGVTSCSETKVKDMTRDVLKGLISMCFSGVASVISGSISGESVKAHAGDSLSHDTSELCNISTHVTRKGGPGKVSSLKDWKAGLNNNATWAVIDRVGSNDNNILGIWKLVQRHASELTHATKLAEALQCSWCLMNIIPKETALAADKVLKVIKSTIETLKKVQEWATDRNLHENVLGYLQMLLNQVEYYYSTTGDVQLWVEALKNEKPLSNLFLSVIQETERYSQPQLTHIKYLLFKLMKPAEGHNIPIKDKIRQWICENGNSDKYNSVLISNDKIHDIPGLLNALRKIFLPAMQTNYVKSETAEKNADAIDIQATVDVAVAVNHLRLHLEDTGKRYELFLLLAALQELRYEVAKERFSDLLTQESLTTFIENCEKVWRDFQSHEADDIMRLQVFLIRFLIESVSYAKDQIHKQQKFKEILNGIQKLIISDLQCVLEKSASSPQENSEDLLSALEKICQGNAEDIQDTSFSEKESHTGKYLNLLGLTEYYPSKISLQDVMTIGKMNEENENDPSNIPWVILQKLIMLDYNGRDSYLRAVISKDQEAKNTTLDKADDLTTPTDQGGTIDATSEGGVDPIADILQGLNSNDGKTSLNPLDVLITIFACCDLFLKQTLAQKMFLCRLAIPFIYPDLTLDSLTFSLWALRSIIVEWKDKEQMMSETSVVKQKMKLVSFIRLRKPSCSKSILLNNVISDRPHNTFWNRECPLGHTDVHLADGLVEATWYLPAGKLTDAFQEPVMFLNLRGNACNHVKQLQMLREISNVIVCCIETTDLGNCDVLDTLKDIHGSSCKVVTFLAVREADSAKKETLTKPLEHYMTHIGKYEKPNTKKILGCRGGRVKTIDDSKMDLRQAIKTSLVGQECKTIEKASNKATKMGIYIDELNEFCQKGKTCAENVISCMKDTPVKDCKTQMLPLQGNILQELSNLQREKQQPGRRAMEKDVMHQVAAIDEDMTQLRKKQVQECNNLSALMKNFRRGLLETIDSSAATYFMTWLKIFFDEISRDNLPGLHTNYHTKWAELRGVKESTDDVETKKVELLKELKLAEKQLADSSLGVEHLLREIAQIYEAAMEGGSELKEETKKNIEQLPATAAKLLMKGQPMEIMDGDASNVPLTWIQAVLSNLKSIAGDKRLFVLSVLGIQSSGKSTLLNTMFGLQFTVSAGRCTRGVFMQLIQVDKKMTTLPYDYVLVVDTEGLRAPELGELKHSHDNQLATFVIGLGDVTIMNIKGENVTEISDVLQIAVHAFLRMKLANKNFQLHRTCLFIHQNVPAINAKEKMRYGCQKLQEKLDEMTLEASSAENISHIHSFNEVIRFNGEKNVYHISDLWYGDPPMAPTNPGYTEKVQEVKQYLLYNLFKEKQNFLTISDFILRVRDLWKGVLSDDFVFSFRNSLAAKAYINLENIYQEISWTIEKGITDWLTKKATVKLARCLSSGDLDQCLPRLDNELETEVSTKKDDAKSKLEEFFDTHDLKDILIQWKAVKIATLNSDIQSFLTKAKMKMFQLKENMRIDLVHSEKQMVHAMDIMENSKALADRMKGKEADEAQLLQVFDEFWIKCQSELATRSTFVPVQIEVEVERILRHQLQREHSALTNALEEHPLSENFFTERLEGSIKVEDVEDSHISYNISYFKSFKSFITSKDLRWQFRQSAVYAVDTILRSVDTYLRELHQLDSQFQELYATSVIRTVIQGVKDHNNQKTDSQFKLLPNLEVKVAVHVCRFAVGVFQKMQEDYEENHGAAKKLDTYRNTAWNLFKNSVNQSTVELITADLLIDHLEGLVKKMVKSLMVGEVVNYAVLHFGYKKYNLMVKVMTDLVSKADFKSYTSFISDAKDFSHRWITSFLNNELFSTKDDKTSNYTNLANVHIQKLTERIQEALEETTKHIGTQQHACMKMWIEDFGIRLDTLPIRETDFEHVMKQDVKDFQNLERLLIMRLPTLRERVLETVANETAKGIRWEGETPYSEVMKKLWGCEAQCPFCHEPCQKAAANHGSENDNHQCIQHRIEGVSGIVYASNSKLSLESCNSSVMTAKYNFRCIAYSQECRDKCLREIAVIPYHPYKDYKTYIPDWDIPPVCDLESSKYWMWFMAKYECQLAEHYGRKKPDIPKAWRDITQEQAVNSLRVYTGLLEGS